MKCNSDVCIRELGSILHNKKNFDITGADVENICRRALIARIREQVAKDAQRDQICEGGQIKKSEYFTRNSAHEAKSHTAYEDINKIDIHMRNFIEAIKECCPSFLSTDPNESKSSDLSKTECLKSFVWDGIYSAGLN